jgi:hypothetical protein
MRQTWRGPLQWIVVDDCDPPTALQVLRGTDLHVVVVRPSPYWQPGQNTLARNLLAAIPEVAHDRVAFIEDDDWYSADYLMVMWQLLEGSVLAGEAPARYYHHPSRQYRVLPNRHHASLCQTGLHSSLLPRLREICLRPSASFIDVRLWEETRLGSVLLGTAHCVGIKGLPGRPGIGIGHRPEGGDWGPDPGMAILRTWVGEADAEAYRLGFS